MKFILWTAFILVSSWVKGQDTTVVQYPEHYKTIESEHIQVGDTIVIDYRFEICSKGSNFYMDSVKQKIVDFINQNDQYIFDIHTHTDTRGSEIDNMNIAYRRANKTFTDLVTYGVDSNKIRKLEALGEFYPILPSEEISKLETEEEQEKAHLLNRRSLLVVCSDNFYKVDKDITLINSYLRKKYKNKEVVKQGEFLYTGEKIEFIKTPAINELLKIRFYETTVFTAYFEYPDMKMTIGVDSNNEIIEAHELFYDGYKGEVFRALKNITIENDIIKKRVFEDVAFLIYDVRPDSECIKINLAENTIDYLFQSEVMKRIKLIFDGDKVTEIKFEDIN